MSVPTRAYAKPKLRWTRVQRRGASSRITGSSGGSQWNHSTSQQTSRAASLKSWRKRCRLPFVSSLALESCAYTQSVRSEHARFARPGAWADRAAHHASQVSTTTGQLTTATTWPPPGPSSHT